MNNPTVTLEEFASSKPFDVHELRRRWKPHKERLASKQPDNPTPIRFHRACSWLSTVEEMGDRPDYDIALLSQWIAFNALYGQWDQAKQEPAPDRECWRRFTDRLLKLDADGRIAGILQQQRRLVLSIFEDEYLSKFFWQEPTQKRASQSKKTKYDAHTWYVEQRWTMILDRILERAYLIRCQLVHGAATHNSKLNRTALHRCTSILGHLLPACLCVMIDHGADEDWGGMCYPPLSPVRPR